MDPAQKVWLLLREEDGEDYDVIGVFSTKEKAQERMERNDQPGDNWHFNDCKWSLFGMGDDRWVWISESGWERFVIEGHAIS